MRKLRKIKKFKNILTRIKVLRTVLGKQKVLYVLAIIITVIKLSNFTFRNTAYRLFCMLAERYTSIDIHCNIILIARLVQSICSSIAE